MNSEKSLINLVKNGDKKAYEVLVLQYQDRLVYSVYKFLKDYELAQDIAQEAFVKAFKTLLTPLMSAGTKFAPAFSLPRFTQSFKLFIFGGS